MNKRLKILILFPLLIVMLAIIFAIAGACVSIGNKMQGVTDGIYTQNMIIPMIVPLMIGLLLLISIIIGIKKFQPKDVQ